MLLIKCHCCGQVMATLPSEADGVVGSRCFPCERKHDPLKTLALIREARMLRRKEQECSTSAIAVNSASD